MTSRKLSRTVSERRNPRSNYHELMAQCIHPRPIPQIKRAKARRLYDKYRFASQLEESPTHTRLASNEFLSPLEPFEVPSAASQTSSRNHTHSSSGTSATGIYTSVWSMDSRQQPKPPHRNKLSTPKRAKAALIRYLSSCHCCHDRRVGVSLIILL